MAGDLSDGPGPHFRSGLSGTFPIRALADAAHEGLVETCGVPPNDRFQLVSTYAPEMMFIDPTFPDVARTPDASIIEILFSRGTHDRSEDKTCFGGSRIAPSAPDFPATT